LGAERGERSETRLGYRAGYYARSLVTRVGKLELRVPRDREGRFSTELFARHSRSEKALVGALAAKGESYRLRDARAKIRKPTSNERAGSAGQREPRREALEGGQISRQDANPSVDLFGRPLFASSTDLHTCT
jgi:hypothetical protein